MRWRDHSLRGVLLWGAATGCLVPTAHAQQVQTLNEQEQRLRAQQQTQAREQQHAAPDVRARARQPTDFHRTDLPAERVCFPLSSLALIDGDRRDFSFLQEDLDRYAGRCVGVHGVDTIVRRLNDHLMARGYVTTRAGLAPQDLSEGHLRVTLVPGRIGAVRFATPSSRVPWRNALPTGPGELLNTRDIEQGLEQFKRVPSQQVTIDIAPAASPGASDLVLTTRRMRPWHVLATVDDSGSRATGHRQGGITLGLDNPLHLNDVLSFGVSRDLDHTAGHGTHGANLSYTVPLGNWRVLLSATDYHYAQTVHGTVESFVSRGKSRSTDLTVQRLLHRTAHGTTIAEARLSKRWAHSFIEDTELRGQARDVTTVEVALVQRQYLGAAQFDGRLAYRRGVAWLGGQHDAADRGPGTPRFGYAMTLLDASLSVPLRLAGQPLQWTGELHAQRSGDVLYGSEFISLGGRYTVRGFDGEQTLAGERGWYVRNTLTVPLGPWPVAAYLGVDLGHVGGPSAKPIPDKSLRGAVLGARGQLGALSVDAFIGWALHGGRALATRRPTTGFQLAYAL